MKIYTDSREYDKALKYWSSSCGDLHRHGEDITEEELPGALRRIYRDVWEENPDGTYCYLAEHRGRYGLALVTEYHELTPDGEPGGKNNYKRAAIVGKMLEHTFPHDVFIGKEMGFPGHGAGGANEDCATELVVFIDADNATKETLHEVTEWLWDYAYEEE